MKTHWGDIGLCNFTPMRQMTPVVAGRCLSLVGSWAVGQLVGRLAVGQIGWLCNGGVGAAKESPFCERTWQGVEKWCLDFLSCQC